MIDYENICPSCTESECLIAEAYEHKAKVALIDRLDEEMGIPEEIREGLIEMLNSAAIILAFKLATTEAACLAGQDDPVQLIAESGCPGKKGQSTCHECPQYYAEDERISSLFS